MLVLTPLAAIVWIALSSGSDDLAHVAGTILPRALSRTLWLLALISIATGVTGLLTAWLTATFDFPFRRLLTVALVLPLAMPTYLAAYAAGEFFDYAGPLQAAVRALGGFTSASQYWFVDIRTLGGAVLVMGAVLYPYVYLSTRSAFLLQGRSAADVARTLGASPLKVFFTVQLPMARPAIAAGLTLVMMETMNDIGAVEYLGVNTLTFAIYDTWLNRGSLGGAAQIAAVMLVFVIGLILVERHARRLQRYVSGKAAAAAAVARPRLRGAKGWAATFVCAAPVIGGFVIPGGVLMTYALRRIDTLADPTLYKALGHTMMVGGATALITVVIGFTLAYSARVGRGRITALAGRAATFGYGVPGTVMALGVLIPLASLDNVVAGFFREQFGIRTGLLITGTMAAIVFALTCRFLTMAEGAVDAGFQKLPVNLDHASRTLGRTSMQTLTRILIPAMRPAVLTAGLLVFIDAIKELPATILLRPFNFNTLATLVYEDASRARVEDAAIPALIIILAGLAPVILVSRSLEGRR
ncbi:iron ABC transporter permease [Rhizobium sp. SG_E_25_P2]|uniref:ABC transporter permease n=1 Tax=Rhizobium sp. SG_E_25_P2 TaxID=2879942 RepID=UPI00247502AC|nr:iron ABC transporter permease [Rhizobium sp. SG_E_25_P2]